MPCGKPPDRDQEDWDMMVLFHMLVTSWWIPMTLHVSWFVESLVATFCISQHEFAFCAHRAVFRNFLSRILECCTTMIAFWWSAIPIFSVMIKWPIVAGMLLLPEVQIGMWTCIRLKAELIPVLFQLEGCNLCYSTLFVVGDGVLEFDIAIIWVVCHRNKWMKSCWGGWSWSFNISLVICLRTLLKNLWKKSNPKKF
jgi:hypothetical protein